MILLLFTYSCKPLVGFYASDCKRNNCVYGFSGIHYDGELLTVDYGTGSNCNTKFKGNVEYRNDSLILIADYINPGARCMCGYSLTYTVKVEDTCDLKIGFEKRESEKYIRFLKRHQRQNIRIGKVSEKRGEILEMRQGIRYMRFMKEDKEQIKSFRNEIKEIRKSYRYERQMKLIEQQRELEFQKYNNPQNKRVISDDVYY
ncbi:MAG: hypothetical protein PHE56_10060 [Bacteroidales bacterium]|nr:hypothetical protein [Bacteroidales bacterium]